MTKSKEITIEETSKGIFTIKRWIEQETKDGETVLVLDHEEGILHGVTINSVQSGIETLTEKIAKSQEVLEENQAILTKLEDYTI